MMSDAGMTTHGNGLAGQLRVVGRGGLG